MFGARVTTATSIRSIVSYRLYLSSEQRAALTFHSDWPYAFDDVATGAIFAAYGSLTLTSELVLSEPVAVRLSADVHREIGVAVGMLMANAGLSTQSAYLQLHQASQHLHRSLPNLARHVIGHGNERFRAFDADSRNGPVRQGPCGTTLLPRPAGGRTRSPRRPRSGSQRQ